MKKKLEILIGCIMTITIFCVGLRWLTELTERKASEYKYQPFYEQEADFDVLFMGSSHVLNGVFPMELWNDYGIVSYNFGGHGCFLTSSYYLLENALEYTSPELVVIDCYFLSRTEKMVDMNYQHYSFDSMPLSVNKLEAVYDIIEEGERMDFIWNFSVYHNRWNELTAEDFRSEVTKEKGAEAKYNVAVPEEVVTIGAEQKFEGETVNIQYLKKMIETCQSLGIDVLLTYIPFPAAEECQMEANRVYDIAQEYGVEYINFLELDVVDYQTDCADVSPTNGHLNASGGKKISDYLGEYITENYAIADQRNNPVYESWYEDYEAYVQHKKECLREQTSAEVYLMALADEDFDVLLEVRNREVFEDERYIRLFENLNMDVAELCKAETDFVIVDYAGNSTEYLSNFRENGSREETALGELCVFFAEDGTYGVYLDTEECYVVAPADYEEADIRIMVMDHDTKELVDEIGLLYDENTQSMEIQRMEGTI